VFINMAGFIDSPDSCEPVDPDFWDGVNWDLVREFRLNEPYWNYFSPETQRILIDTLPEESLEFLGYVATKED
jgi:hypothetical protein